MIDRRLLPLVHAPHSRSRSIARVKRLMERYVLLVELADLPANTRRAGEITLQLLREHPSALLEGASLTKKQLAARGEAAEAELINLKAAAPLPAPLERSDRTTVLAIADVAAYLGELRFLKRALRRLPADPLLERYLASGRPDLLENLDADMIRAIGLIPRGQMLKAACALAAMRHGVPELRAVLAPPRPKDANGDRVFACKSEELDEGRGMKVDAFGKAVAVFKHCGAFYAIDDFCPHRGGPLHQGEIEHDAAVCPLHGWAFDLKTGAMHGNPKLRVVTYGVSVDGDSVYVLPSKE